MCAADADGQWRARLEIRRALETFDSASMDAATLGALVAGGYADLAVRNKDTSDSFQRSLCEVFTDVAFAVLRSSLMPTPCIHQVLQPILDCPCSSAYSGRGRAVAMICSCRQSTAAPCKREALGRSSLGCDSRRMQHSAAGLNPCMIACQGSTRCLTAVLGTMRRRCQHAAIAF